MQRAAQSILEVEQFSIGFVAPLSDLKSRLKFFAYEGTFGLISGGCAPIASSLRV